MPELISIAGCNAAGKSTFIRSRLNELEKFKVLMTDVYKGRTKDLASHAIIQGKDIIIETVFNDETFKDLPDQARNAGYHTSLIVLFLDSLQQSIKRVALRGTQQSGITISGSNIEVNFIESFKNITENFFYFDQTHFIYTGVGNANELIMSFRKDELLSYSSNSLNFPKKFASYSFQKNRLDKKEYEIILANKDYKNLSIASNPPSKFKL